MNYVKLLDLLKDAHSDYAHTIAESARIYEQWKDDARHGRDAELRFLDERLNNNLSSAESKGDLDAYNHYCVEYNGDIMACETRVKETMKYAAQWYEAATKGAAADFNIKLIAAFDESRN